METKKVACLSTTHPRARSLPRQQRAKRGELAMKMLARGWVNTHPPIHPVLIVAPTPSECESRFRGLSAKTRCIAGDQHSMHCGRHGSAHRSKLSWARKDTSYIVMSRCRIFVRGKHRVVAKESDKTLMFSGGSSYEARRESNDDGWPHWIIQ